MKVAAFVVAASLVVAAFSFADSKEAPEKPDNAGFAKMKSLAGHWKGKLPDGKDATATYRIVSGGHAVEEVLGYADMVTMYHEDGDNVMLTHYCAGNNQPRMRAKFKAGDTTMNFAFVDVTNLPDANAMHMHTVNFTFVDNDHIKSEWTNYDGGKQAGSVVFDMHREK
jgi:hypothetical protein